MWLLPKFLLTLIASLYWLGWISLISCGEIFDLDEINSDDDAQLYDRQRRDSGPFFLEPADAYDISVEQNGRFARRILNGTGNKTIKELNPGYFELKNKYMQQLNGSGNSSANATAPSAGNGTVPNPGNGTAPSEPAPGSASPAPPVAPGGGASPAPAAAVVTEAPAPAVEAPPPAATGTTAAPT